jgi:hypothetical protein
MIPRSRDYERALREANKAFRIPPPDEGGRPIWASPVLVLAVILLLIVVIVTY